MPRSTKRRPISVRCPRDVKPDDFDEMMRLAPKGAVLNRHYIPKGASFKGWWRDFEFHIEGEPSKESGLKRGDTFTMSCVTLIKARG